MAMETFELYNVILQTIFVIFSIIVGIHIISKYPKFKRTTLLLVGIVWIGMIEPWFTSILSYLYTLITGKMLSIILYLFIAVFFIPVTVILWTIAFIKLVYNEKKNIFIGLIVIYNILFEIFFLYFLFTDPSILGTLHGPINIEWHLFLQCYFLSVLLLLLATGVIFYFKSQNSNNQEIKLRGKFLLIAFISYVVGGIIDAAIYTTENIAILLITRILFILSAIEFYYGFTLPKWIKRRLIKD